MQSPNNTSKPLTKIDLTPEQRDWLLKTLEEQVRADGDCPVVGGFGEGGAKYTMTCWRAAAIRVAQQLFSQPLAPEEAPRRG